MNPPAALTLVIPLRAKAGMSLPDFYQYWLAAHCEGVHAARVDRCIATKDRGAITLAGVRGVAVADLIRRLGADSQRDAAVSALFLPDLAGSR
jgi:hypothetical protein